MGTPPAPISTDEEWFDLVDEQDRVVGRERRSVVHRDGLRHRATHLLVTNAAGELFLQKRSMLKDTAKGLWDSSASGHVDSGEDYGESVVREAGEEIGLHLQATPEEILYLRACPETGNEFVRVYRTQSEGPFVLHPAEIEQGEWVAFDRLEKWIAAERQAFATSFLYIWERVRDRFAAR